MDDPVTLVRMRRAQQQLIDIQKADLATLQSKLAGLDDEIAACARLLGHPDLSIELVTTSIVRRLRRLEVERKDLLKEIMALEQHIMRNEMRRDRIADKVEMAIERIEWNELEELQQEHLAQAIAWSSFAQDARDKLTS